jgi:hypothetical protein
LVKNHRLSLLFVCLTFLCIGLFSSSGSAQEETLPRGIGLYSIGYRSFVSQTQRYNANGKMESLGQPFNKDFSGTGLLRGDGGSELRRLAEEIARFEGHSNASDSMINQLNLGRMQGDVQAEVNARILAFAFGATDRMTLFVGVPYVSAEVRTNLSFARGSNGAQYVKQKLGNMAFDELQAGLDQAAALDAATITASIEQNGYAPIDHWSHQGIGDVQLGSIYAITAPVRRNVQSVFSLRSTLVLPTGYVEDPDILTDVNIGNGYYSLINEVTEKFVFFRDFWVGASAAYGYNFSTSVDKRVPEADEGIVDPSRRSTVSLDPGHDMAAQALTGWNISALRFAYTLGIKAHTRDTYRGSLPGNYDILAEGSDMTQAYHIASVAIFTPELYQKKRFPVPFILQANYHMPITAYNSQDERYFEITLSSFFSTPMAMSDREPKRKRSRNYRTASNRIYSNDD